MAVDHSPFYHSRITDREVFLDEVWSEDRPLIIQLLKSGLTELQAEQAAAGFRSYDRDIDALRFRLARYPKAIEYIDRMAAAALSDIRETIQNSQGLIPTGPLDYPVPLEAITDEFLEARENDLVYIRTNEHRAWWKQSSSGYTDTMADAGVWTLLNAWNNTLHCGMEKEIWFDSFANSKRGIAAAEVGPLFGRQF